MEIADRLALLVAAQVQAGMLDHTYWAELIVRAVKVDEAIKLAACKKGVTVRELDALIGERQQAPTISGRK